MAFRPRFLCLQTGETEGAAGQPPWHLSLFPCVTHTSTSTQLPTLSADAWNKLVAQVKRARPLRGVIVSGDTHSFWRHPWFINARWEWKDDGTGEWRAFIRPGFVNGRDAHIPMPADWPDGTPPEDNASSEHDVPLTNEPQPFLILDGWRNPLTPSNVSATLSGQIIAAPAEGYPKSFEKLGVKPAAKGGDISKPGAMEGEFDATRTREIRAMDVVLAKARIGTRLQIDVHDPLLDAQTETISTVFLNDALRTTGGRAKLRAVSKYVPQQQQSLPQMYGTLLNAGDAQLDELKLATIWIVSPPDAATDAEPHETWTPYPQHFVFWNLQHASRLIPPRAPSPPLRLHTGLAGGIGDRINDALLSFVNDQYTEAEAFLNQADASGMFWST